jgi:hypothetical protein
MRRPLSWFFASVGEVEKNVKTRILRPAVRMLLIGWCNQHCAGRDRKIGK